MTYYYRFDENGYYTDPGEQEGGYWRDLPPLYQTVVTGQDEEGKDITETVEIPQMEQYIPDGMTTTRPPDGLYLAHWDGTKWEEARPPAPTEGYDPATEQPIWDTNAKVWAIVPIPTQPPQVETNQSEINAFVNGMIAGLGGVDE